MQDDVRELVERRSRQAMNNILRYKDSAANPHLPPHIQLGLRKVILDELNDFTALVLETLESASDGEASVNVAWLERIDSRLALIHEALDDRRQPADIGS